MSESQHSRLFLIIGGLGAIFSSLCCLGPLLLLALGFSGAWLANLTALEPYRPVFILISFIALFFAWRRIFRSQSNCQSGEACASTSDRGRRAVIFYGVLVLALLALVFPYLLPLFY
ncbi:mercuric ion transporter MerT [Candidatus Methylobacter oryzae]|uniref:Mercuric transport protein MerT n=1 Tax=Candidatus Methylobacter oryzae TaxID=2497749 RepID=A0ABY3C934_9GAMM|nr:mercuric ion transporter MerT [Candidatus Methylobacter oryzae]TRW93098.1 mercuric ion transporter MerT [Candidatus Methylobacter oryzae]